MYTELERAAKNKVAKRSGVAVLKTNLIEKEQKAKVITTVGTKRSTRYVIGVNGTKGEFEKVLILWPRLRLKPRSWPLNLWVYPILAQRHMILKQLFVFL